MPIKKSNLEQRWYYRIAKVFFLLLPLLVVTVLFFRGYIDTSQISINDIVLKKSVPIMRENSVPIMYVVGGLILYYVVLKGMWRGFLYIAFGGLEDDTKKKDAQTAQLVNVSGESVPKPSKRNGVGSVIAVLIFMALLYYIYFLYLPSEPVYPPSRTNSDDGSSENKTSACSPPTGCGSLWRCSGSYYVSGVRTDVDACFPRGSRPGDVFYSGWSGTCRQCP